MIRLKIPYTQVIPHNSFCIICKMQINERGYVGREEKVCVHCIPPIPIFKKNYFFYFFPLR